MKIKVAVKKPVSLPISTEVENNIRLITTVPIVLDFDTDKLPAILTDTIYGWYKLSNNWMTGMEADAYIVTSKQGWKLENPIDSIDAHRTLTFLGYMETREWYAANRISHCRQYRLTAKGLKTANKIAERIGDKEKPTAKITTSVECDKCEGTGVIGSRECSVCKGTGVVSTPKLVQAVLENEKETQRFQRIAGINSLPEKATPAIPQKRIPKISTEYLLAEAREKQLGIPLPDKFKKIQQAHRPIITTVDKTVQRANTAYSKYLETKPISNNTCPDCEGIGIFFDEECGMCSGTGELQKLKVKVKVRK